jgi:hypothetical protein
MPAKKASAATRLSEKMLQVLSRRREHIVAARLGRFFGRFRGEATLPRDPLFSLGETWRAAALDGKLDLRPRDVINWAREGFRREQEALVREGGPAWLAGWGRRQPAAATPVLEPSAAEIQDAIDRRVARQLAEHKARRLTRPETLPPDADQLAGLAGALVEQCRSRAADYAVASVERAAAPRPGVRPAYDLLLHRGAAGRGERTWLSFVVTASGNSATGSLRRLLEAPEPPERLFLVTDQRRPLPLGSRGEEYLQELRTGAAGQFRHVELTFADCAELDALQAVVSLARSGDLEIELAAKSRPVSEAEVIASLHRQGRYRTAPLLRDLLGEMAPLPAGATP